MLSLVQKKEAIANFWAWFDANKASLEGITDLNCGEQLEPVIEQLQKVNDGLSVAISMANYGVRDLVISAEGDSDLFPVVQQVVGAAPTIKGWTVTAFRQPVNFDFTLEYGDLKFTPSQMYFIPLLDEGAVDLIIYVRGIKRKDPDTVADFGLITMDNVLGEYDCATKVRYFDFVDLDEAADKSELRPLAELRAFLNSVHP